MDWHCTRVEATSTAAILSCSTQPALQRRPSVIEPGGLEGGGLEGGGLNQGF